MTTSIIRCRQCQHSLVDSLAALAGLAIQRPVSAPRFINNQPTQRTLHTSRQLRQSSSLESASQSSIDLPPTSFPASSSSPSTTSSTSSSLPWYLQIPSPTPPVLPRLLTTHQDLPPLPQDAPTILQPILSHLSTSIGLDNLTLIDLRDLSPPPALGSNLLMIIGTARSTKHLNVSADRFCRWCRSEYKLRPYADGLLGRNELKLKLRRRARRLKLAASVGNTMVEKEGDDGITTGWVCVNLGMVDDVISTHQDPGAEVEDEEMEAEGQGGEEVEYVNPEGGYIGFGASSDAPRIVVQMFTEEKRADMDLEGLWAARLARSQKRRDQLDMLAQGSKDREREIVPKPEDEEEMEIREEEEIEQNEKLKEHVERGQHTGRAEDKEGQMEEEIDKEEKREGMDESKPMGGIGAS